VASVGTIADDAATATHRIEGGRLSTYERPKRPGLLKVAADPAERVVVGAVAVGPEAGEWIGQLTLAIRAQIPVAVLLDTIQPYPTFSERSSTLSRNSTLDCRRSSRAEQPAATRIALDQ